MKECKHRYKSSKGKPRCGLTSKECYNTEYVELCREEDAYYLYDAYGGDKDKDEKEKRAAESA